MNTTNANGRMPAVMRRAWPRRAAAALALILVACTWVSEAGVVVARRRPRRVRIVRPDRTVVLVNRKPPLVKVEVRSTKPGPRYVWRPGHWACRDEEWVWIAGVWVLPPTDGDVWVPAKWVKTPGGWELVEGHWK